MATTRRRNVTAANQWTEDFYASDTANLYVQGDASFSGTISLQTRLAPDDPWSTVEDFVGSASFSVQRTIYAGSSTSRIFRLGCSAYTSGTCLCVLS